MPLPMTTKRHPPPTDPPPAEPPLPQVLEQCLHALIVQACDAHDTDGGYARARVGDRARIVADRGCDRDPTRRRLEIQIGHAIALAAPREGFAADLASANPAERLVGRGGVGMLFIAYEELRRPLIAGIASALDGLIFAQTAAVSHAAEFHLPTGNVLHVVFFRNDGAASFQHQSFQSLFR